MSRGIESTSSRSEESASARSTDPSRADTCVEAAAEVAITAPDGWRDRLIKYSNDNTDGVTGRCLEINDLWLTKLAAGRPKDFEFCRALVREKLITANVVRTRTPTIGPRVEAAELSVRVERLLGEADST